MNPSDVLEINPSINISRVVINDGYVYDIIGNLSSSFPAGFNVLPTDNTLNALIKVSNGGISSQSSGGSPIDLPSNNGYPIIQTINDVKFYFNSNLISYSGCVCKDYIFNNNLNYVENIINQTDINNLLSGSQIISYYYLIHIGKTISLLIKNPDESIDSGSVTLQNSSNVGVYNYLTITNDEDPLSNNSQYKGYYRACVYTNTYKIFTINDTFDSNNKLIPYSVQLKEDTNYSLPFTFFLDNFITPNLSFNVYNYNNLNYNSGIPCLTSNSDFTIECIINNATTQFFNPNLLSFVNNDIDDVNFQINTTIINDLYNTNSTNINQIINIKNTSYKVSNLNIIVRSVKNSLTNSDINMIIDNNNEVAIFNRVNSGDGLYPPTIDFSEFISSHDISDTSELIYILGYIQYPRLNYNIYYPPGPDYSILSPSKIRYFTIKKNITSSISRGKITLVDVINFNKNYVVLNLYYNNSIYIVSSPYGRPLDTGISCGEFGLQNNKFIIDSSGKINYCFYFTFGQSILFNTLYLRLGFSYTTNPTYIGNILIETVL
jgi:hypothetical protein